MKISCIGLDSICGNAQQNYIHAKDKIKKSLEDKPDVIVLPELFSTGFFPKNIKELADADSLESKAFFSSIAKEYNVNIVAGSIATKRDGKVYNTSHIFDRNGNIIAMYDKTHLFTYMNEDDFFSFGENLCTFKLDGISCGIIICYDLRFCEFIRTLALKGIELLFMVSAWPLERLYHLETLLSARAIENQIYVALSNSTATINEVKFAGNSMILDPFGKKLAQGDENEHIITSDIDFSVIKKIRNGINIYQDRRIDLYDIRRTL